MSEGWWWAWAGFIILTLLNWIDCAQIKKLERRIKKLEDKK